MNALQMFSQSAPAVLRLVRKFGINSPAPMTRVVGTIPSVGAATVKQPKLSGPVRLQQSYGGDVKWANRLDTANEESVPPDTAIPATWQELGRAFRLITTPVVEEPDIDLEDGPLV